MITVSGFIAEVGDIGRFDNPKQLQSWRDMQSWQMIPESTMESSGSATEGRKRLEIVLYEAAISLVGKNAEFKEIQSIIEPVKKTVKKMQSVCSSGM